MMDYPTSSEEKTSGLIWIAVVVSVVIHVSGMLFMRPQTMTEISHAGASVRSRKAMRVRERPADRKSVSIDVVGDVKAKVDFPRVLAEEIRPEIGLTTSPLADSRDIPFGARDEIETIAIPKFQAEHSEIISRPMDNGAEILQPQVSPIDPKGAPGFGRAHNFASSSPKVDPSPIVPSTPPEIKPTASKRAFTASESEIGSPDSDKSADLAVPSPTRRTFVPRKEVMAEVDEKVVESEKTAVRELLTVREAYELTDFVNTVASSASHGDWTYFKVSVMPRNDLKIIPKDVVILFDASGSIREDRLKSCRENAKAILRSCMNTYDRFNLVAFRDDFEYAFRTWRNVNAESIESAERWMRTLGAHGRTDVFSSVASVLKLPRDPKRPLIALVVTDGIANKGVSETSKILSRFTRLNDGLISVYMYGVKDESNRELITVLTRGNRGESFVYEGRRRHAGRDLEPFSERFRDPVLSDLRVIFTSDSKAEAYPVLLKNLYRGDTVDIVGRVPKGTSEIAFSLKGLNGEKAYEGLFRYVLSQAPFDKTIPERWAAEKAINDRLR